MKRWGIIITAFYAVILVIMLMPAMGYFLYSQAAFEDILMIYRWWGSWLLTGILVGGQAVLLFLSVDTSWRRLKPRQHVAITALLAGLLTALLTFAAIWAVAAGVFGGKILDWSWSPWHVKDDFALAGKVLGWWVVLWAIWGAVFYLHYRSVSEPLSAIVSWLLKGSVLELLIVVPAHIVVRHRDDCSAPAVTGWGIVTGIAVMLLCFGPGVLALYKKKLDASCRKHLPR